jgi:Ran GTPase-activating protein (RanGAP) involved in mRNA processing and transport
MSFSNLLNPHCTIVDGNHLSRDLDFIFASLSKCRSLTTIGISNNAFTGRLPTSIAICKPISYSELHMIISINLFANLFQGRIPGSFSNILNIEELDLFSNALFSCHHKILD